MQTILRAAAFAATIALAPSIGVAQSWLPKSQPATDENPWMGQWGLHQMLETHAAQENSGGLACAGKHNADMGCAPATGVTSAPAPGFRSCDSQANIEAVCPRQ